MVSIFQVCPVNNFACKVFVEVPKEAVDPIESVVDGKLLHTLIKSEPFRVKVHPVDKYFRILVEAKMI